MGDRNAPSPNDHHVGSPRSSQRRSAATLEPRVSSCAFDEAGAHWLTLADPEGNEFDLVSA